MGPFPASAGRGSLVGGVRCNIAGKKRPVCRCHHMAFAHLHVVDKGRGMKARRACVLCACTLSDVPFFLFLPVASFPETIRYRIFLTVARFFPLSLQACTAGVLKQSRLLESMKPPWERKA